MQFVKATYSLEGDGLLAFQCYEIISSLNAAVNLAHHPNVQALARLLSGGNVSIQQQWEQYALIRVQPGYQYYLARLNDSIKIPLASFKAAWNLCPHKVQELQQDCATVDSFAFPFVDATLIARLKIELPQYIAEAEDVSPAVEPLQFWKSHSTTLPAWAELVKKVVVQPSSAASERVFSLLVRLVTSNKVRSLMLQYNRRDDIF